jgi:hypothetical protein
MIARGAVDVAFVFGKLARLETRLTLVAFETKFVEVLAERTLTFSKVDSLTTGGALLVSCSHSSRCWWFVVWDEEPNQEF